MKKHVLIVSMCLAMTTTSALAVSTTAKPVTAAKVPPVAAKPVQNTCPCPCPCHADKPTPLPVGMRPQPTEKDKKMFEARMNKERELMYNALNLTKEQRDKAIELDKKSKADAEPLFEKVRVEKAKLFELKSQKASEADIAKQKSEVKIAKCAVKKHFAASRRAFQAILTKEQRCKLKEINAQRRADMERARKEHGKSLQHKGLKGPHQMTPHPLGANPDADATTQAPSLDKSKNLNCPKVPKCNCEK